MFKDKKISVVIPCLNEAQCLEAVLKTMPEFIDEIIVVDNGSTDNSVKIALDYAVRVVSERAHGYGKALLKGIEHASGDVIIFMDADGSHPAEALTIILNAMITETAEFASGCRFPLKSGTTMPKLNIASNYFISFLVRLLFRIPIYDSQSGMMAFKRGVIEERYVRNRGMGFSQEAKIRAWRGGRRCIEVHIPYIPRIRGVTKFNKVKDSIGCVTSLLNLWTEQFLRITNKG